MKITTEKTLKKYISGIDIQPGFISQVLAALKLVSAKMKPEQRLCTVLFDEVKIDSKFSYYAKTDQIFGFENYGDIAANEACKVATHALVFTVRGICRKWKQVFGVFFLTNTTHSSILKKLLVDGLRELYDSGLEPVSVICDMGSNNQRLFNSELNICPEKPFFFSWMRKKYIVFMIHLTSSNACGTISQNMMLNLVMAKLQVGAT